MQQIALAEVRDGVVRLILPPEWEGLEVVLDYNAGKSAKDIPSQVASQLMEKAARLKSHLPPRIVFQPKQDRTSKSYHQGILTEDYTFRREDAYPDA